MALNYSFELKIPNGTPFAIDPGYALFFQLVSGSGAGYTSADDVLTNLKSILEGLFGGTFAWTISNDGTNDVYAITYTGLNSDPADDPVYGEIACIALKDDNNQYYAGAASPIVLATPAEICTTCYWVLKPACQSSYTFSYDLLPATVYIIALYTNNGSYYTQQVTTNGSGEFTIDATAPEFPDGLFTPEAGGFIMKIFPDSTLETPETITLGTKGYNCFQLEFSYGITTTSGFYPDFNFLVDDYDNNISADPSDPIIIG